jgi:hypothetical protein
VNLDKKDEKLLLSIFQQFVPYEDKECITQRKIVHKRSIDLHWPLLVAVAARHCRYG